MKIIDMNIKEIRESFLTKKISMGEIVTDYLSHIQVTDQEIAAYLYVNSIEAKKKAVELDERMSKGLELGAFAGVPMALKDNICTVGMPTTCGSRMLENYQSPFNATVVEKLYQEDATVLGKLNLDEFAMGSTTENSFYQTTKNPHNLKRVPGGSSGGSAAAVASKQALFTLGSDTGGSIRQPASFCGVVGLKPSYGRISRYGLIAFASSLDQIGPMTRTVEDMAYVSNLLMGHDAKDSTSVKLDKVDFTRSLNQDIKGMRIALPKNYFKQGIAEDVKQAVLNAAKQFEKLGAIVEEVEISSVEHALPAYYIISSAEASSNLARFDGIQYGYRPKGEFDLTELYKEARSKGFGKEVKRRILLGTYALSSGYYDAYYKKAQQVRGLIRNDFDRIFSKYDLVISPTAPTTAYPFGTRSENPIEMYMGDIFTVPVNIAGLPALSMNCGYDRDGLPIGMQLIGKSFDEETIIKAAHAFERSGAID